MTKLVCPICGNDDPLSLRVVNDTIVCRKCIRYQRMALLYQESSEDVGKDEIVLDFPLSEQQKQCALEVKQAIVQGNDVLLEAVCGAGKTEMLMESIAYALANHGKVGFLIPRRQVVLEVSARLVYNFPKAKVVPVCQGYQNELEGDIIVATTHQAVRYPNYFDLLILDEPDAFPYKGNKVLKEIVLRCKRKNMIYSTATPSDDLIQLVNQKKCIHVQLNSRYTRRAMIVPLNIIGFTWMLWIRMIHDISVAKRSVLLFVPTKKLAKLAWQLLKSLRYCQFVTSETDNKEEIIEAFRSKQFPLLISTSILERGVTFKDIDVLILYADHPVFDQAALVQMAGRVGRDITYWQGRCIFYSLTKNHNVRGCIERIEYANQSLSMVQ